VCAFEALNRGGKGGAGLKDHPRMNDALLADGYEKIGERTSGSGTTSAWMSRASEDASWDEFLQESPFGQFQQSTIWARTKSIEGWKPLRLVLTSDGAIAGGFQLLWRSSWWGTIGYVSKGPVVLPGWTGIAEYASELLQDMARREGLRGVVVQPPDACPGLSTYLADAGFRLNALVGVADATWIIDLRDGFEAVTHRMQTEARRRVRQAADRCVMVRQGGKQDLQMFFDLMLCTCRRQKVSPNPGSVRQLFALWDAAQPSGCLRLFFADYGSKTLAGSLCIAFGKTFTLWKKGWTSTESQRHPNELLAYEVLKWACLNGYEFADFSAFDKRMAITLIRGEALTQEQARTRYMFLVKFGGSPRLLPPARLYLPNSWMRGLHRIVFQKRIRREQDLRLCLNKVKT
jgi:hypothetical protein